MIKTFKCKETERLFNGQFSRRLPHDVQRMAARKLEILASATELESLRIPPSNHLEALSGNRLGQYSIRINKQWRLCFVWYDGDAFDVEIVDYH
ncbi:MAG: type II toxin-antitoxin system RelE/ParE family toxin [Pseudomonadota bacterium]